MPAALRLDRIVDVTLRDGALGLGFPWPARSVRGYVSAIRGCGLGACEVGFVHGPAGWDGVAPASPTFHTSGEALQALRAAAPGLHLWRLVDAGNPALRSESLAGAPADTLVRIAVGDCALRAGLELAEACARGGIACSVNLKHSGLLPVRGLVQAAMDAAAAGAAVFYIVDTSGTMYPAQVADAVSGVAARSPALRVGFHGHDSLGLAVANSLAAVEAGASFVDGSMGGVGAGGGNALLEALVLLAADSPEPFQALHAAGEFLEGRVDGARGRSAFWGRIGCDTATRRRLDGGGPRAAWEWRFGRVISQGEHTSVRLYRAGDPEAFVRKSASGAGAAELAGEIEFLTRVVPGRARVLFPDVLDADLDSRMPRYDMPFYAGSTLRQCLADEAEIAGETVARVQALLDQVADRLLRIPGTIGGGRFATALYAQRPRVRLQAAGAEAAPDPGFIGWSTVTRLSEMEVRGLFAGLAAGVPMLVLDRRLGTLPELLERIADAASGYPLRVPAASIRMIHGDLHFGNVLLPSGGDPVLLDPNGFLMGGDLAYDLGKVLMSVGWHDAIIEGIAAPIELCLVDGAVHVRRFREWELAAAGSKVEEIRNYTVRELLPSVFHADLRADPRLLVRSAAAAFIHMLALAPTLLRRRPREALTMLVEGMYGLCELEARSGWGVRPSGELVNLFSRPDPQ